MAAACWGQIPVLELLAKSGADLDAKTKDNKTLVGKLPFVFSCWYPVYLVIVFTCWHSFDFYRVHLLALIRLLSCSLVGTHLTFISMLLLDTRLYLLVYNIRLQRQQIWLFTCRSEPFFCFCGHPAFRLV